MRFFDISIYVLINQNTRYLTLTDVHINTKKGLFMFEKVENIHKE